MDGKLFYVAIALLLPMTITARAGVGPENLIVVVNADSFDSRTIANHYVELRQIPSTNVVFLKDVPKDQVTSLEAFRERILKPLLAEIDSRGLSAQTRAIAYSTGFPYAVNIEQHCARIKDDGMRKLFTSVASLNGLTYFYRFILADNEAYLTPEANLYARMPWDRHFVNPFNGDDAKRFDDAKKADSEGGYEDAAGIFLELLVKHPTQPPLGILASRSLVMAGKFDAAMDALRAAFASGWTSGVALQQDVRLAPLKDRQDFKDLVEKDGNQSTTFQHAVAFEGTRAWTRNGWWLAPDQGGISYLPSFLLAVTEGQGTTVGEAIEYLERASKADNTFPEGTFYITLTGDIRTKARSKQFPETLLELKSLGHKVAIERSVVPEKKLDVLGCTVGTAKFDWLGSGSSFLPGALADNLTSTGGMMHALGQTKLTEFLRAGAAAASGTVVEPYVVNESPWQFKFPIPQLHVYYAQGLSAVEAFYLACSSPYQLLIVGDPLCQPFARQPAEMISGKMGIVEGQNAIIIEPRIPEEVQGKPTQNSALSELEIYIDGRLIQRAPILDQYRLKLGELPGGKYELRAVMVGEPITAPRKTIQTWITAPGLLVAPETRIISNQSAGASDAEPPAQNAPDDSLFETLFADEDTQAPAQRTVEFELSAVGADKVYLDHFGSSVAMIDGDEGRIQIDLKPLGDGPIRLRPYAEYRGTKIPGKAIVIPMPSARK